MVLVINLAVRIKLKRKKKIWSTYLQSVLAFYPKQTKENYPQFTKLDTLVVLQQHFMFHRSHRRMCGSSDSYKHFTDKVQNGCSPPDNWLGKQQHDWWWTGLEKTWGPNFMLLQILKQQAKKKKFTFQLFNKITFVGGRESSSCKLYNDQQTQIYEVPASHALHF